MELIIISALFLAVVVFSAVVILKQQRTIERLTDRLMARNYVEYVSLNQTVETPTEPKRDPVSWYDDVSIEGD